MRTKNRTEIIKKVITTFIACDGKEFQSKSECEEYEEGIIFQQKRDKVMRLKVLENYAPCDGYYYSEDHHYTWFKVNNQEECDLLVDVYDYNGHSCPNNYPAFFCIEEIAEPGNKDYFAYWTSLDNCTQHIKELYEKLGFTVDIKCK